MSASALIAASEKAGQNFAEFDVHPWQRGLFIAVVAAGTTALRGCCAGAAGTVPVMIRPSTSPTRRPAAV